MPPPVDSLEDNHYFDLYHHGFFLLLECRQLLRDFADGWAQIDRQIMFLMVRGGGQLEFGLYGLASP